MKINMGPGFPLEDGTTSSVFRGGRAFEVAETDFYRSPELICSHSPSLLVPETHSGP